MPWGRRRRGAGGGGLSQVVVSSKSYSLRPVLSKKNTIARKRVVWIARVSISIKWHDPMRLGIPVVSCRIRSDTSHEKNRVVWGLYHRRTHGVHDRRPWLILLVNPGDPFNVHDWLQHCVAMSQHCEKSGCWKEDRWFVITWLYSIYLLVGSRNVPNHGLRS